MSDCILRLLIVCHVTEQQKAVKSKVCQM